jgi:hypothetical protein
MWQMSSPASLLFASLLPLLCGCPADSKSHLYPDDPLFINRKPLEVTPTSAEPIRAATPADPQIPPVPTVVRLAMSKQ